MSGKTCRLLSFAREIRVLLPYCNYSAAFENSIFFLEKIAKPETRKIEAMSTTICQ
jgi:hypothetical protein